MIRLLLLAAAVGAAGCNLTTFTANQTAPVLAAASPAFNQEPDVQLAREAAPGQLKTVEGFLMASPENESFIKVLAEGFCSYSFGFIESDLEDANFTKNHKLADELTHRATGLYLRCMNYGLKLLDKKWEKALNGTLADFEARVKGAGKDNVPGMFWTAMGLVSAVNLNRDDIDMVAYLPKAEMLFKRIVELDEKFYNGGAHMALGMIMASQPRALGGNPDAGLKEFQRAIELTHGKFLMPMVLMAQAYGTITQDRKFFHDTLVKVLQTSPAVMPEERLANELAHIRARRYLDHEKELF